MIHELKTFPEYFKEVVLGNKPFEVRKNDRPFKVGDYLMLREYEPKEDRYTGNVCMTKVTYMLTDETFCKEGYVVLGIRRSRRYPFIEADENYGKINLSDATVIFKLGGDGCPCTVGLKYKVNGEQYGVYSEIEETMSFKTLLYYLNSFYRQKQEIETREEKKHV